MILLIEDNHQIAEFFTEVITGAGYEVDTASTGQEALEKFQENTYQLALVDLSLPDINGADVAAQARAMGVTTPMVAVSGAISLIDPHKLKDAGFVCEPISKPVRPSVLVELVERYTK